MFLASRLVALLKRMGVDRAIAYTVMTRGWSILVGPLTIYFLVRFFSPEEQGIYYTFASILGLQVFFELGLGFVILNFAAHEKSGLEWTPAGTLEGEAAAKSRLASLLQKALIWYGAVTLAVILVVLPVGLIFFARYVPQTSLVNWRWPWVCLIVATAFSLFLSPLLALVEGCGRVTEITLLQFRQTAIGTLAFWLALAVGGKLFASSVQTIASFLFAMGWLLRTKKPFLVDLLRFKVGQASIHWRREVWPFQWKIALSWLSGYFMLQLFNPILLAYHGAAAAGQMGMSMSLAGAMWSLAVAWVSTKTAPFGTLVAQKRFDELDRIFFPALWQSLILVAAGGTILWVSALFLHLSGHRWSHRLLDPLPLGLLVLSCAVSHIITAQANYLRAHKEEPFLFVWLISGALIALTTYFLGRPFASTGIMAGYLVILTLSLIPSTWIFQSKRRLWHGATASRPLEPTPDDRSTRPPLAEPLPVPLSPTRHDDA
jgi:hypothetical protein